MNAHQILPPFEVIVLKCVLACVVLRSAVLIVVHDTDVILNET